jgi:hypothetical protein
MPEGQAEGPASAGDWSADADGDALAEGVASAEGDAVAVVLSTGGDASRVGSGVGREQEARRIEAQAARWRFTISAR